MASRHKARRPFGLAGCWSQPGLAAVGEVIDRGLIGFSDELEILVSRQVNDRSGIEAIINPGGKALAPARIALRPHPAFLGWHRENCFKQ